MRIDEILGRLNLEIEKEYGVRNAIHTITMDHEGFNQIMVQTFSKDPYPFKFSYQPANMNDCVFSGVRILVREKP